VKDVYFHFSWISSDTSFEKTNDVMPRWFYINKNSKNTESTMTHEILRKIVPPIVGLLVASVVFVSGLLFFRERNELEGRSVVAVLLFPDKRVEIPYEKFETGECPNFFRGCDGVTGSDRGDAVEAITADFEKTLPKLVLPFGVLSSALIGILAASKVRPSTRNPRD